MDGQYVIVIDAPRQRIGVNYEREKVTSEVQTFGYRFGKVGLIHQGIVDFHKKVRDGESEAERLWNEDPKSHPYPFSPSPSIRIFRNNAFLFEQNSTHHGIFGPSGGRFHRPTTVEGIPVLFYDQEEPYSHIETPELSKFEKYFIADLGESEVMKIEADNLEEVVEVRDSILELSGTSQIRSNVKEQLEMLRRYGPNMLPPWEIPLEITRREITKKEAKQKANRISFQREAEENYRKMTTPGNDFYETVIG